MNGKPLVVITGIDTGIGKALCEVLVADGLYVVASFLEANPFPNAAEVFARKMDLRVEDEIESFARFVASVCAEGGFKLRGVVHNAGIALGGPIEEMPTSVFRDVFEVNFFGLVTLTRHLIPLLRQDGGTFYLVGSTAGRVAFPYLSPYATSKFALEGFAGSLRREMARFGVKVVILEPGAFGTPIWTKARAQYAAYASEEYRESLDRFKTGFVESGIRGPDPSLAARAMARVIKKRRPARRYVIDSQPLLMRALLRLPEALLDSFILKRFGLSPSRSSGRTPGKTPP